MKKPDLTKEEQEHVRAAVRFLAIKCGTLKLLSAALGGPKGLFGSVGLDRQEMTASIAVRLSRLAQVSVDDMLAGRYPVNGMCPHCGRGP
jgi:hypothetical protein